MTDSIVQQKICNKCGQEKPVSEYYKQNRSFDGYALTCKSCAPPRCISLRRRVSRTCRQCGQGFEVIQTLAKQGKGTFCSHDCVTAFRRRPQAAHEKFWSKVRKTDGCWVWTGGTSKFGYGQFHTRRRERCGAYGTHIVSYEMAHGPVPEGLCVLHRCDNPPCVRPDHLFLGTRRDNNIDMAIKERAASNLTAGQVKEMRSLYASGAMSYRKMAVHYGLSYSGVREIVLRRRWAHVP